MVSGPRGYYISQDYTGIEINRNRYRVSIFPFYRCFFVFNSPPLLLRKIQEKPENNRPNP